MPEERTDRGALAGPARVRSRGDWGRGHRHVIVHDDSMRPTLRPGDRLDVDLGAYRDRAPVPGEIVVVRDPEEAGRLIVKRVESVGESGVFVVGDDRSRSRDSRAFGPVPLHALVGRAVRCYAPAERRREL